MGVNNNFFPIYNPINNQISKFAGSLSRISNISHDKNTVAQSHLSLHNHIKNLDGQNTNTYQQSETIRSENNTPDKNINFIKTDPPII